MAYQVKFTEVRNPAKPSITVEDQSLNVETSLTFVGKNYAGYAPLVAENFLHLLENFAGTDEPSSPVQGQLWYDNTPGVNLLKVFDGSSWTAAGAVKKGIDKPGSSNSLKGDLFVDTQRQQLYIWSGSTWLLVGPQFSSGVKTGPIVEEIDDATAEATVTYPVISLYSNDQRIAIISKSKFTPKQTIIGFPVINRGITLTAALEDTTGEKTRFNGVATSADALRVGTLDVAAANFLRSDASSNTDFEMNVRSSAGVTVGKDLNFTIGTDTNKVVMVSKTTGNSFELRMQDTASANVVMHIESDGRVGLGKNNVNPSEILSVDGNITATGKISLLSSVQSTELGTGSIVTSGGLSVAKNSNFGGTAAFGGIVTLDNVNTSGTKIAGSVLLPNTTLANTIYDIGSATSPFRNVYANSFVGNFNGNVEGSLRGNVDGSAGSLASATDFYIKGDIETTSPLSFNGITEDGTATLRVTATSDIITNRVLATDTVPSDTLLIYRAGTGGGLKKITKQKFLSNIAAVPVGAIFPFAGPQGSVPNGYLLCDGSEVDLNTYNELYTLIRDLYKRRPTYIGDGTFALPDLRGRFPLGIDSMFNSNNYIQDGGQPVPGLDVADNPANRVSDDSADLLGGSGGTQTRSLNTTNLPDHTHALGTANASYYAMKQISTATDTSAEQISGSLNTGTGYGIKETAGVTSETTGRSFSLMNPWLAVNYIIFTGVYL